MMRGGELPYRRSLKQRGEQRAWRQKFRVGGRRQGKGVVGAQIWYSAFLARLLKLIS